MTFSVQVTLTNGPFTETRVFDHADLDHGTSVLDDIRKVSQDLRKRRVPVEYISAQEEVDRARAVLSRAELRLQDVSRVYEAHYRSEDDGNPHATFHTTFREAESLLDEMVTGEWDERPGVPIAVYDASTDTWPARYANLTIAELEQHRKDFIG